jgi:hypothetical protein
MKMNLRNKPTELDESRPDRLASSMLIIGIIIVSQFALYSINFYIVGGRLPPPYILPFIFVGGIGIICGSFRIVSGSSVTKESVKATLIKMRVGAIAGSATAFAVILIAQVIAATGYWVVELLIIAIPGALFFGISPGGIGGLILGNSWNNKKTAFVGGAIAGITTSSLYISIYIRSL